MKAVHVLAAVLMTAIWGLNFVVIRIGLDGFPPLLLSTARFVLTALPAIFFIKRPPTKWRDLVYFSVFMFAIQYACLFAGMAVGMPAGLASLIVQMQVFFTVLFAAIALSERPKLYQVFAGLVACSGIAWIVMRAEATMTLAGLWLTLVAGLSWAIGNLIMKRIGSVNPISLVVWGSLLAVPPLAGVSFLLEGPVRIFTAFSTLRIESVAAAGYIAYISTIVGFSIWGWLLRQYPAATVAPFTLLVPIFGLVSAALVLDEPLPAWKLQAGALVLAGVAFNVFGGVIGRRIKMSRARADGQVLSNST